MVEYLHFSTGAWHPSLSGRLPHRALIYSCRSRLRSVCERNFPFNSWLGVASCPLQPRFIYTFIHRKIWAGKNPKELFFNAKFDFKSTLNRDWDTSHHKHPVCQSPARESEKLEQLERLRSEDAPASLWLPILLSLIGFQAKTGQSQIYKFKEFAKCSNFEINFTRDTSSEVAW